MYLKSKHRHVGRWFCGLITCLLITGTCLLCPLYTGAQDTEADTAQEKHIYDSSAVFFNWKLYNGEAFTPHKVNAGSHDKELQRLKNEDDFWYMKEPGAIDSLENRQSAPPDRRLPLRLDDTRWVNVFWMVIVAVFLLGIVYFLMANKILLFTRDAKRSSAGGSTETGDDIFQLPYADILQKAYARKDFRLAVRILYLQTLKLMSEHHIIRFQPDFTNVDYLFQLHNSAYYTPFSAITRHYEYVWYGEFAISEQAFQQVKQDFINMQNMVGRP